jgi:hypothetical protein
MAYIQWGTQSEAERAEAERQHQIGEWSRELEAAQSLIRIKLGIALRNGLSRTLKEQIDEAGLDYADAYSRLLAACRVVDEPKRLSGKRRG